MKAVLALFLLACAPRGVPIQVLTTSDDEAAVAQPWIDELNVIAGCQWIYGNGDVGFDNHIGYIQSDALIDAAGVTDSGYRTLAYWDGQRIVMRSRETDEAFRDFESLIFLHELGHAVGFEHSGVEGNWMNAALNYELAPAEAARQFVAALGPGLCEEVGHD